MSVFSVQQSPQTTIGGFIDQLAAQTTITVQTALGEKTFAVGNELAAPPGLLTKLFKPRFIVRTGRTTVADIAPAGPPEAGFPVELAAFAAGAVVLGFIAWRAMR